MDGRDGVYFTDLLQLSHGVFSGTLYQNDFLQSRGAIGEAFYLLHNIRFGDEENFHTAVLDDVFPDMRQFYFIHGYKTAPQAQGSEMDDRPFHAVIGDDTYGIIFPDIQFGEPSAQIIHTARQVPVGYPLVGTLLILSAEKKTVAKLFYAIFKKFYQVIRFVELVHIFLLT